MYSKYNKDRPFLVISHHASPSQGQKTEQKGWGELGKWNINESIVIVDRVSNKHMVNSSVIIDILQQKIVKNRFDESYSKDDVIKHYMTRYNKEVIEGIDIWMKNRVGGDKQKAEQLITNLEDELKKIKVEVKADEKTNNID